MAGVVYERTNLQVRSDSSERSGSQVLARTEFYGGTGTVPTTGASLQEPIPVVLADSVSGSGATETLFDASKLYKITIEELS